jgi:hypothetical protein
VNLLTTIILIFAVYNFFGFGCVVHRKDIENRENTPNIHSAFVWIPRLVVALNIGLLMLLVYWWFIEFAARVNEPGESGLGLWAVSLVSLPAWVVTIAFAYMLLNGKAQQRTIMLLTVLTIGILAGNIVAQLVYNWRFR